MHASFGRLATLGCKWCRLLFYTSLPVPCFYLTPKQDNFNQIPELQICIAESLYDAEAVLSNPSAFKAEDIRTLRDPRLDIDPSGLRPLGSR